MLDFTFVSNSVTSVCDQTVCQEVTTGSDQSGALLIIENTQEGNGSLRKFWKTVIEMMD